MKNPIFLREPNRFLRWWTMAGPPYIEWRPCPKVGRNKRLNHILLFIYYVIAVLNGMLSNYLTTKEFLFCQFMTHREQQTDVFLR